MTISITEALTSRTGSSGDNASYEIVLTVKHDQGDPIQAITEACKYSQFTPSSLYVENGNRVYRNAVQVGEAETVKMNNGVRQYLRRCRVSYINKATEEPGPSRYSFSVAAQSVKIYSAISQHAYAAAGNTPEDYGNIIGVAGEGNNKRVEGVSVFTPVFSYQVVNTYPADVITLAWRNRLINFVNCINNASFDDFATGEVLCLGVDGAPDSDAASAPWTVTYKFQISKNRTNMQVGTITIPGTTWGWDYVWATYKKTRVGSDLLYRPTTAYAAQVYRDINMMAIFP